MSFRHLIPVRYGEVDLQGVVFNSHYLAYADDTMTRWMAAVGQPYPAPGWDFMVRHATIDWRGSAGFGDTVLVDSVVRRWGTTSFEVHFGMSVLPAGSVPDAEPDAPTPGDTPGSANPPGPGEDVPAPVVEVVVTYVGVDPVTREKSAVPTWFRERLEGS